MIYFDSAATTFQKPPSVERAVVNALRSMSSVSRGGYESAVNAARTAYDCRRELAELFGVSSPEQVIFTMNATHALNLAIKSLVPRGGRAVISGYEHNAVTRPLRALNAKTEVAAGTLFDPESVVRAFARAITPNTDAVICNHVSNVFGFIQPIGEIARLCRERGVPLIVDASQSAGILPLDLTELRAAYIAMPGHKGLYGPQGSGVLLCGEGQTPETLIEGGTGSLSALSEMPEFLPDRAEAGTHNVPAIAGLLAGIRFVKERGIERIFRHERALASQAAEGLSAIAGVKCFSLSNFAAQSGVLSFQCENLDAETVGEMLSRRGVAVRAGLHCAPLAHQNAGTIEGGTVRLSFSAFNTPREVAQFLRVMRGLDKK